MGSQSSFSNVNLYDKYFLQELFSGIIYPDLSKPNLESIKSLQKYYMEWFIEESKTQIFTFPVNTVTFYKDDDNKIQDEEFLDVVSELNCYNGAFNIYTGALSSLSTCCRLRSDMTKTKEYVNSGFGVSGVSIGSHRVVTLNLPRIAFQAEDDNDYFKKLEYYTKIAQDLLDTHRGIMIENINRDKLPLYTHKFMNLSRQFSTIGFIGINEACEIQGYNILDEQGSLFAKNIINKINDLNEHRTKEDGHIRNVEQIPGESAAVMFANKDRLMFTNQKYKIYGNQYIPLWKNVDIHDRIKAQGMYDSCVQGGSICHLNVTDSLHKNQMKKLILAAAGEGCIYFAINMNNARCNSCGKLFIGKFDKSPCHDADVTNYLRVVGFLVPVDSWMPQRREEYKTRQFYSKKDF
jgi:ribonucleoside-triphosphate reductase (formate)